VNRKELSGSKYLNKDNLIAYKKVAWTSGRRTQKTVAFARSDVTPTMATGSATVDTALKWRLKPRKHFV
jgi:hypothetical protein